MGEGQSWAEPDLAAAVDRMRFVFRDREEARRRAARGVELIAARHSEAAVARAVETRLRDIRSAAGLRTPN